MNEEYIKNIIRKYLKAKANYDLYLITSCGNKLEAAREAFEEAERELRSIAGM